ncbi:MAG TPA: CPBP family intramembrane glutamic endopeptidase [Anaerolineales bacterium]
MKHKSLIIYFVTLTFLCAAFIVGARALGEQGMYLAQGYMLTPAIAAILTRLFFHEPKFRDANLRFGRIKDYLRFWLISVGITALSYVFFTLFGSISWDFTGQAFLDRLAQQFEAVGQDMVASLPPGFTPQMMLMIYFIGGLTVFNILPGIITGFGEEFGHRGFMFPMLYRVKPWIGILVGGFIWYAWHWPVALLFPQNNIFTPVQNILNFIILGIGSVCTFIYLAYVYVKSRSVWVTSLAHIVLNNSASAFSYFAVIQNQLLANLGLAVTMLIVAAALYYKKELKTFEEYFEKDI